MESPRSIANGLAEAHGVEAWKLREIAEVAEALVYSDFFALGLPSHESTAFEDAMLRVEKCVVSSASLKKCCRELKEDRQLCYELGRLLANLAERVGQDAAEAARYQLVPAALAEGLTRIARLQAALMRRQSDDDEELERSIHGAVGYMLRLCRRHGGCSSKRAFWSRLRHAVVPATVVAGTVALARFMRRP